MIQRRNSDLDLEERFTRESNRLGEKELDRIAKAYLELLRGIGEDLDREGLRRTPDRAARALNFSRKAIGRTSMRSLTMPSLSRTRARSFWSKTLSCIRCANTICFPLSDAH